MSTIFNFFAGLALALVATTAFGQCVDPRTFPEPTLWDGVRGCRVPQGTPTNMNIGTPMFIRQGANISLPPGYRARQCDDREQFARDVKHALIGAALGAIPGIAVHNRQRRDDGALIGAIVGIANSEMTQCVIIEQVAVQQQQRRGGEGTAQTRREYKFSGEASSQGVDETCRLLSDGNSRDLHGRTHAHGQVIAVSSQGDRKGWELFEKNNGEDCNEWRRRAAHVLVR